MQWREIPNPHRYELQVRLVKDWLPKTHWRATARYPDLASAQTAGASGAWGFYEKRILESGPETIWVPE